MTQADGEHSDPAEKLHIGRSVARDGLLDALARAHFQRVPGSEDRWRGTLAFQATGEAGPTTKSTVVEIVIPGEFPFEPPKVHPISHAWAEVVTGRTLDDYHEAGNGWHRDHDNAMCLFTEADHTLLPWASGEQLLDQARAWLTRDANGWAEDEPALDLDHYLQPSKDRRLILYGELGGLDGKVLRLRAERNNVLRVGGVTAPRRRGPRSGQRVWQADAVLVLDAGDLQAPIRTWDDLLVAVGAERAKTVTDAHLSGLARVLITYRRSRVQGVLGVALERDGDGGVALASLRTAPDDLATRTIRAHSNMAELKPKRVAIVGAGAIGSIVADLLHRSGVGELHLIDSDLVLPGNTTRHLLGNHAVGLPKARAVAEVLKRTRPRFGTVTWSDKTLKSIDETLRVLGSHDVVVDATADSTATAILAAAARAGTGQLLSVCVLGDGYAVRVDRTPTRPGDVPLPSPHLPPPSDPTYETGCGSPVSAVPPAAMWEAAAIAARHTIGLLLDPKAVASGEQRIIGRGADQ
jgi:molybdopterin/thiamine biosynthesis adenylyltransferase